MSSGVLPRMIGVARAADPFLLGFDVEEPTTPAMLAAARGRGFAWVGRYLNNLSAEELGSIFAANLGVLPYTWAMTHEPLSAAAGTEYGAHMAAIARGLGCPEGVHIAIDLEAPPPGSACGPHVNAMADSLRWAQFGAALYVGVPQPLSGPELFALKPDRYIKGGGRASEPSCSWAALQLEPLARLELAGAPVDVAVTKEDYEGRSLVLWWPR